MFEVEQVDDEYFISAQRVAVGEAQRGDPSGESP
jgi:hypothetical protein